MHFCNFILTVFAVNVVALLFSFGQDLSIPSTSLLIVTLDGNYYAINKATGQLRWTIKDEPTVTIPYPVSDKITFLPDPKDGSLYAINDDGSLRKLPFTIPELVSASPCRSSDGILYTGRKIDVWYSIDMLTGVKQEILSAVKHSEDKICPQLSPYAFYMGKSEYTMAMYDSKTGARRWNVTYSSVIPHDVVQQYDLVHFTATSTGFIVTVDQDTGKMLWSEDFKSPIVAMYYLDHEGLHSIPFTSVASETLTYLTTQIAFSKKYKLLPENATLYPRLFIGQSEHGFYALPSLADDTAINILKTKLLPGPTINVTNIADVSINITKNISKEIPPMGYNNFSNQPQVPSRSPSSSSHKENFYVAVGYYEIPPFSTVKMTPALQIGMENKSSANNQPSEIFNEFTKPEGNPDNHFLWNDLAVIATVCVLVASSLISIIYVTYPRYINQVSKVATNKENNVSTGLANGQMQIGKITVDLATVLGKGCDGTFVFKGKFEERDVAVKRILSDCFEFADREVSLLREADAHPNVIRYFLMEQDLQFRYLALELCSATVADCIENNLCADYDLDAFYLLQQATCGLDHLHSMNIVHRDIKPQNVLISLPNIASSKPRVMISDFGLCKKLSTGRMSFSRKSGTAGTDGWIAPEMMNDYTRTTCKVDIFSMGCVYYYVISNGQHPFGDGIHRQANIINGHYVLKHLTENSNVVALHLVEKMLSSVPEDRPPCSAVLKHPIFWSVQQQMDFLQDVSDRIEKEPVDSPILLFLERNGNIVVRGDWKNHIGSELQADLRKFRTYKGRSIRDLMRAIRNKKHHYRELSEELRNELGETPSKFIEYFTSRFPKLIPHVYYAMQCCKMEPAFARYYSEYDFKMEFPSLAKDHVFAPNSPWYRRKMQDKTEEIATAD
ncbi:hypothetical protein CHUAL_005303 [Chamberlinius hualienensis]